MDIGILKKHGIDYQAGVKRFMDDSRFYEHMLNEFLKDDNLEKAAEAFALRDYRQLFERAHALKGVSGTLDMTELFHSAGMLTEYLRGGAVPDEQKVAAMYAAMQAAYRKAAAGITAAAD